MFFVKYSNTAKNDMGWWNRKRNIFFMEVYR